MEERETRKLNRASKEPGGRDKAKRKINYAVEKRTRESNWKEVPTLSAKDPLPIAVFCGDLHLSHKPPLFRSCEKDWYETQRRYLQQLYSVAWSWLDRQSVNSTWHTKKTLPIICAGDVFDKWNSPPELINLALEYLPEMYAVPGQHDLPNHSYENIKKSAFWTLVEAGKIKLLEPGIPTYLDGPFPLVLHGFPYGYEVHPPKQSSVRDLCREIAVIHSYIWTAEAAYPGAPADKTLTVHRKSLEGYDVAVYGDNHIPFESTIRGKCTVYNCGAFMRRKSDEFHRPSVGLFYPDGSIKRHFLDISQDNYLSGEEAKEISTGIGMQSFIEELTTLGDAALNFAESMNRLLERDKVPEEVKQLILNAMER